MEGQAGDVQICWLQGSHNLGRGLHRIRKFRFYRCMCHPGSPEGKKDRGPRVKRSGTLRPRGILRRGSIKRQRRPQEGRREVQGEKARPGPSG